MEFVFYKRPFIKVDSDFLESDLLKNCYQRIVYIYLKVLTDADGKCSPSVRELSQLTKIGVSKVKITLKELEQKGMISKKKIKINNVNRNLYILLYNIRGLGMIE